MTLSADQFEFICHLLDEQAGMALAADQGMFVESRLLPVATRHALNQVQPLIARLRDHKDRLLTQEVIESLVTHETSFFRDSHYFDELTECILPRAGVHVDQDISQQYQIDRRHWRPGE